MLNVISILLSRVIAIILTDEGMFLGIAGVGNQRSSIIVDYSRFSRFSCAIGLSGEGTWIRQS